VLTAYRLETGLVAGGLLLLRISATMGNVPPIKVVGRIKNNKAAKYFQRNADGTDRICPPSTPNVRCCKLANAVIDTNPKIATPNSMHENTITNVLVRYLVIRRKRIAPKAKPDMNAVITAEEESASEPINKDRLRVQATS
jgi:hypothetical protein